MAALVPQIAPFLSKCYNMVEDPTTNSIISWGQNNNSLVIWDEFVFCRDILPRYFKHSQLSSFIRQLNIYGFRKVDPDRLEFANEGFLRGQKNLLKTIIRNKNNSDSQTLLAKKQNPNLIQGQKGKPLDACVEVGNFGLEEEIEILKRDRVVLMQEIVRIRKNQEKWDVEFQQLMQTSQSMQKNQQQLMALLAMSLKNPNFIYKLLHYASKNGPNKRSIPDQLKKRRYLALQPSPDSSNIVASSLNNNNNNSNNNNNNNNNNNSRIVEFPSFDAEALTSTNFPLPNQGTLKHDQYITPNFSSDSNFSLNNDQFVEYQPFLPNVEGFGNVLEPNQETLNPDPSLKPSSSLNQDLVLVPNSDLVQLPIQEVNLAIENIKHQLLDSQKDGMKIDAENGIMDFQIEDFDFHKFDEFMGSDLDLV